MFRKAANIGFGQQIEKKNAREAIIDAIFRGESLSEVVAAFPGYTREAVMTYWHEHHTKEEEKRA